MSWLRSIALLTTVAAVAILLGSMLLGINAEPPPRAAGADTERTGTPEPEPGIQVEVLNAAGKPGLARAATRRLRAEGFDVVFFGNATRFGRDSSVVLDRSRTSESARRVARALGIERVRSEPDSTLYLDVTVFLGADWEAGPEQLLPAEMEIPGEPRR